MRKKLTFKLSSATLLLFLILCLSLTANGQTKKWEVFTAKTEEGIVLKFCVSDVENKECHVGANDGKRAVESIVNGPITIPSEVNGFKVVRIGPSAFMQTGVTSVTIPSTVTSVGSWAFRECASLQSVSIPNSVTEIGDRTFSECPLLSTITLPQGLKSIESGLFYRCRSLSSITIPASVKSISQWEVFDQCYGLSSIVVESGNTVYDSRNDCNAIIETATKTLITGCANTTIPNGIVTIGRGAFNGHGPTSVVIPESVTDIQESAFHYYKLESVTFPNNLKSIGKYAFSQTAIKEVTLPSKLQTIGDYAFHQCDELKSVTIPSSVKAIGDYVFRGCKSLTSITLQEGLKTIGGGMFSQCGAVKSITIPSSVSTIENAAFSQMGNLEQITSLIVDPFEIDRGVFGYISYVSSGCYNTAKLYVPAGSRTKYEFTPAWSFFTNIIEIGDQTDEESLTGKGWESLIDKKLLKSGSSTGAWIMLQSNGYLVSNLGGVTCNSMRDAYIDPDDPNILRFYYYPDTYNKVIIRGNTVKLYDENAPSEMVPTASYTIADGDAADDYDHIGDNTFRVKTDEGVLIRFKVIDENLKTCKVFAISETGKGTNGYYVMTAEAISTKTKGPVTIPAVANGYTVTEIGEKAFEGCSSVQSFIIPDQVGSIGISAFESCSSLQDIFIYAMSVPTVDTYAFRKASIGSATLHVPAGTGRQYAAISPWIGFGKIIEIGSDVAITKTGDANGDGKVDIDDLKAVLILIFSQSYGILVDSPLDINGDGKVDIVDIVKIINLIKTE